jgi:hypothetical protein
MLTALMLATAIGAPPDELARAAVAVEVAKLALSKPTPAIKQDPYRMEYAAFHAWIRGGGRGVLVVGIPDRYVGGYETHCWVPSGFGGLRDGEYDCKVLNGNCVMTRREVAPNLGTPFATRTPAQPAGAFISASPAGTETVRIDTAAPWMAPFGVTSPACTSYG